MSAKVKQVKDIHQVSIKEMIRGGRNNFDEKTVSYKVPDS
jgi:hypothetical protein